MATFRLSKWACKRDGLLPMAMCVKEKERAQWQGNTHFYIDSECATVCVCIGNPFVCPRERENSSAVSCSLIARPTGSPKETRSLHLVCVRLYACAAWASPFQSERARKESPSNLKFLAFSWIPNVYARHAKRSEWSERNANCRRQKWSTIL